MFESYRSRTVADGPTNREAVQNMTKRQMVNYMLDSPSLSYVSLGLENNDDVPALVHDVDTFHIRRFLFLPDTEVNIGDYLVHDGYRYLATDKIDNDIYPQLIGEVCNIDFPIYTETKRTKVGVDGLGRPIYKTDVINIVKPCVMDTKIYSQANNSPIPLPDGAMIVKLPYSTEDNQTPNINSTVMIYNEQYKITTISYENVINNVGVIEVQLQRIPVYD